MRVKYVFVLHANVVSHTCELPKKLSQMFVGTVPHKSSIDMNLLFMLLQITLNFFAIDERFFRSIAESVFVGFLVVFEVILG